MLKQIRISPLKVHICALVHRYSPPCSVSKSMVVSIKRHDCMSKARLILDTNNPIFVNHAVLPTLVATHMSLKPMAVGFNIFIGRGVLIWRLLQLDEMCFKI